MKLLITGATGFVGRNLLLSALADERYDEIVVPVRNEVKFRTQLLAEGVDPADPRIRVTRWGDFAAISPIDHAVHTAGVSFARDHAAYFSTNVDATLDLAATLPATTRLLVLSSQSAGGPTPPGQSARRIADADAPVTLYGESKCEMERLLLAARPATAIWRPPMILGPRDAATLPLFKMASASFQIKPGRRPKTYSWIAVDDFNSALLAALHSDAWDQTAGRAIYTASPSPITDLDLITTACAVLSRPARILRLPHPVLRTVSRIVDTVPPLRRAVPTLTRDRVRELDHDHWVVESSEFQRHFLSPRTATLATTLATTWRWIEDQRPANPA